MKVLLIHPRLARSGGLETRLFNYIEYFQKKGAEVHIACRRSNREDLLPGMTVHKFNPIFVPHKKANYYFNQKLEKWKKPVFDFELSLGRTTIQKNILAPATHKGYMRAMHKMMISPDDQMQIDMDHAGYNASENIFACSGTIKKELIELYHVPENKIQVLYPPFNIEKHQRLADIDKQEIRNKYGLPAGKIFHLFVSTSHERKGLPLLLEVFKKLKGTPHTLLIIGNKVNISHPNIISMGYFPDPQIAFALGNYLLHPAKYEPYGQIVNEALHHQIPVIISVNTGAGEILKPDYGWIAPDYAIETWVEMIKKLPGTNFNIPSTLLDDLGFGLNDHMQKMLQVNGLKL
jgi:glycosyltransferase involved in cell wall biosynthesis